MLPEQRDRALIADMLRYALEVQSLTRGLSYESFLTSRLHQLAIERASETVGEAARFVSGTTRDTHPDIPWEIVARQRHVLAHDYDEIVPARIWKVATVHVPALIVQLAPLLPPPPADPEPPAEAAAGHN